MRARGRPQRSRLELPAIPYVSLGATSVDFTHAVGLDMHQYVERGISAYEPDVTALLLALLGTAESSRLINVGANAGYFAFIAKRAFGGRVDVEAYEPMPELAERIRRGVETNRVEIAVHGVALDEFVGVAPFHLSARSDTSNSLNPHFRPARDIIEVPVSTLDHEFPTNPARRAARTILLVDTESTEPAVLRGGLDLIERERPAIICEVLAGRTEEQLTAVIERIGYRAYQLTNSDLVARDEIVGDRTYEHRDWLFLPADEGPPADAYRTVLGTIMK